MSSYRIHADNLYQQRKEIMFTKNNCGRIDLVLPCCSASSHSYPFMLLVNYDIWSRPDTYSFPQWYGTLDVVLWRASSYFHLKKFLLKLLTSYQTACCRSPENHLWKCKSNLHTAVTGYIVIVPPNVLYWGGRWGILINTR
jgi:hypothetical protein